MVFFDVVIIGAGPAGLKCAQTLSNTKYRVLVLEKNSQVGPKVCAGGLTGKDLDYLKLPPELIDFSYRKVKLHVNGLPFRVRDDKDFIYTIDRKNLGQWQVNKLSGVKNIKIKIGAKVSKIDKGFVVVNKRKIGYGFLVGADGSASIVRQCLGIKPKSTNVAIQYILPTKGYQDLELFFDSNLFSAWYAWIFPHRHYVSIGCGANPAILPADKLNSNFKNWLDKRGIDVSGGKYEAFAINCDYQGYRFGNVFLAGDAGGFASELTGEGIYQALVTGEEVAKTILNSNYQPRKINDLLTTKRRHNKVLKFLIECGKFRTMVFYLGAMLFGVPFFKKKAIGLLG
ncbi:MAG: NAD(P)/FAD-dependent oxidoreductase [Candidatus Shapirobacteria bacterium]|nr:NAD(P)/FAD-dependent oxidoreductase [Candidatus Shapirobacteria bacterium]MDD5073954.1 NAD(P)/FAD-dependent oxidoreductase [Candidatus Shapirobacteria bacterium]MDD5481882.1 NAD(P)/FAD-dependent oxidoreductase [Candidatus Shapirobacteria bacterium]